jgi:large subunit ribosomal protein L37Ae
MARTKKVGIAGRYGARYGKTPKQRLVKLAQKKKHACPNCRKLTLKRQGSGVWVCGKCGFKFAGGAYKP